MTTLKWGIALLIMVRFVQAGPPTGRYKAIVDQMHGLQQSFPSSVHVFSIGQNDEGTDIYAMRVSTTPQVVDPQKVGHIIVSTHHGNESATPVFTMQYTAQLLKWYVSDELWKGNLADLEWTIIPVLNITGYNANQRWEYGQDPNRDYPGPCLTAPGGKLKSIRLLMALLKTRVFSGSLTVHGYVGSLTYPWGMDVDNTHSLDHNLFEKITAKAASLNQYQYGTSTDVIYPANGCYEDFVYWHYGHWSLLLELRSGSTDDIKATVPAIFTYFDQLDASPSTQHALTGHCARNARPDLHVE